MSDRKKEYMKEWRSKNKEKLKEYALENKEKRKEYMKEWRSKNKEKNKEYCLQWRLKNKEYKKEWDLKNKEKQKEYRLENNEKIKEYRKIYNYFNKEKRNEQRKNWLLNNKEKRKHYINKYVKNRKKIDYLYKLRHNIRRSITGLIKKSGYTKKSRTYEILGCTYEEFKEHLEKQFTDGMTWENQGKWHLDHIYPVSLTKDEEHLIKLNHYTNFQPLWAIDNLKKSNKIIDATT